MLTLHASMLCPEINASILLPVVEGVSCTLHKPSTNPPLRACSRLGSNYFGRAPSVKNESVHFRNENGFHFHSQIPPEPETLNWSGSYYAPSVYRLYPLLPSGYLALGFWSLALASLVLIVPQDTALVATPGGTPPSEISDTRVPRGKITRASVFHGIH